MVITPEIRQRLQEKGVSLLHAGSVIMPDHCIFEAPCGLKRMQVVHSLEMGAFSFAKSGYYFAARIGRYCSIEDDVQIGRGSHPIAWGSTSPVLYQDHIHVFNQKLDAAAGFRTNAKAPPAKVTTIGNDVHIGHGALISPGVSIGDGAIIKPMTVVSKDVPPFAIVEGNPGVITGMRFALNLAAEMRALAWWRFALWDLPVQKIETPLAFLEALSKAIYDGLQPYTPEKTSLSKLKDNAPG